MAELIIERAFDPGELEVQRGDGWTLFGRIVELGRRELVRDSADQEPYLERFAPDAFDRDVAKGGRWVNLRVGHYGPDHDAYLGRCLTLEARTDGLYGTFRLDREHPLADAARSGELTGWSVGAKVFRSRRSLDPDGKPVVDRLLCAINHVAATPAPQHAGAGVLVVRDHQLVDDTPPGTPLRDALQARLRASRSARA